MREIENEVFCDSTECRHNRDGACIFLNKHGNSTVGKGKDRMIVMCAWYDRKEKWLCEGCRYAIERPGKSLLLCEKKSQLIPPKRFACERYRE